jgi:hypothetical protein
MNIRKIFLNLLNEQIVLKGTKTKPIVDAIKNRNPVSFYYSGPRKPEKNSVLAGNRIKSELVAIGLSKKGNLIVRGWVQPPSVSKKGFEDHGWRTFMVSRMSNIQILTDEIFNTKRPKYKEGDDNLMSVTYVTSNWTDKPEVKQKEPEMQKPDQLPQPKSDEKPDQLPQPKSDEKPSKEPEIKTNSKFEVDVYNILKTKIKEINGKKVVSTEDYQNSLNDLYKRKENEWIENQKKIGGNIRPGEGTRNRFRTDSEAELKNLLKSDNVEISDEEQIELQETIKRFKSLISY